jgi:hypothetical protein
LLEIIGTQSEHYYDCRNPADWLFLIAKARVSEVTATEILNTLSQVDAIDKELWMQKVIWIQKFVDRLCEVYRKRGLNVPQKPSICDRNDSSNNVSVPESTQSKVKESKVKEVNKTINSAPKKSSYGEFQNVLLTAEEYGKLCAALGDQTQSYIDRLDGYIASKGVKYKSHYATILNWWRKDEGQEKSKGSQSTGNIFADIGREKFGRD